MGTAAISWMIACGLFCGVAGGVGAVQAGADSPSVDNGPGRPDVAAGAGSNGSRAEHHGGYHRRGFRVGDQTGGEESGGKVVPGVRLGSPRLPGPFNTNIRAGAEDPGWPWPWPWPPCWSAPGGGVGTPRTNVRGIRAPQSAGGGGGGNGGGIAVTIPSPTVPGQPGEPTPVQVGGGGHQFPAAGGPPTVDMPPVIGLAPVEAPLRPVGPPAENVPAAETGAGGRPAPAQEPNPVRERPPASVGNATEAPASFRVGYPEYLREAKTGEVAALAVPGVVGLLALTAFGGLVGYRQARAGHLVRATGTARFLQ
jgi:hypothetical protein